MIIVYKHGPDGAVAKAADPLAALSAPGVVWIDLENPTEAEEIAVERAFGIEVLTVQERKAYEESARFYAEGEALYMTVTLLGRKEEGPFVSDAVTFILLPKLLVTVRSIRPRAFEIGQGRASARIEKAQSGADVFDALLESVIERIADILQEGAREVHELSVEVFRRDGAENLKTELRALGRWGSMSALAFDVLASLQRGVVFLNTMGDRCGLKSERLTGLRRDIEQLERTAQGFQNHVGFVQAAALGIVGATQNNVLKALSVATMAFVPPTLIASIFGMNFKAMEWFDEPWGPWLGFALMIVAPLFLFLVAKWRRWF